MKSETDSQELCVFLNSQSITPSDSLSDREATEEAIREMKKMWGLSPSSPTRFLGPNPVSIERKDLDSLHGSEYLVSLKSDGVRYMLLLTLFKGEPVALMLDRSLRAFEVEVWGDVSFFEKGTLLDGELVYDYSSPSGVSLVFLLFDAVCVEGKSCTHLSYTERLTCLNNVVLPLSSGEEVDEESVEQKVLEEKRIVAMRNKGSLRLSVKKCRSMSEVGKLWEKRHESGNRNDGLILTRNDRPLSTGTCRAIFKWKPDNTVDVRVSCTKEKMYDDFSVFVNRDGQRVDITSSVSFGGKEFRVDFMRNGLYACVLKDATAADRDVDDIFECNCRVEGGCLTLFPIKRRIDKPSPNDIAIVFATVKNVVEGIGFEELLPPQ